MEKKMSEEEIVYDFEDALAGNHFFVCYQPQINHSTGRMVGAEALIRWRHPVYGIQSPADFIPVLEKNRLISKADLYVFETVCGLQKHCLNHHIPLVPISFNVSRYDICQNDFTEEMEVIRKKYDVPARYLRVEITESSAIGGIGLVLEVLEKLHSYGYIVEMDDFGSGYSSLNVLKDLAVDIIKLDMSFLKGSIGGRGGIIISSVVHMAKWLQTPVIAEGVETIEQADFMKSIGCNYIQGYLYAKPLEKAAFLDKLLMTDHEPLVPAMNLIRTLDAGKFWDPESMETLIFSNYVGAAAIFKYEDGLVEILRINKKYLSEIGMNMTEKEVIESDPWKAYDSGNRAIYEKTILKAIESGDEESCETWRTFYSKCCGEDKICIRSTIRMIGRGGTQYLFYATVQNVTAEKRRYDMLYDSEKRFRVASEQINVYAWEYTIATKEMRPCFRCMRDLGLPALLKNYPDSAIEMGIFPPDYADMYRDWHRQLAEGVDHLEAVIPLTVGRIPFHVRYTTEYDENGRPLKAYGSAALVVDGKQ